MVKTIKSCKIEGLVLFQIKQDKIHLFSSHFKQLEEPDKTRLSDRQTTEIDYCYLMCEHLKQQYF